MGPDPAEVNGLLPLYVLGMDIGSSFNQFDDTAEASFAGCLVKWSHPALVLPEKQPVTPNSSPDFRAAACAV